MICIGLKPGTIFEVIEEKEAYLVRFVSDEGNHDLIAFQKDSAELQKLAELIEKPISTIEDWNGTKVRLFFGPEISSDKYAIAYGIAKSGNEDKFLVPEYLFKIIDYTPTKDFYSCSEIVEILEYTEDQL